MHIVCGVVNVCVIAHEHEADLRAEEAWEPGTRAAPSLGRHWRDPGP